MIERERGTDPVVDAGAYEATPVADEYIATLANGAHVTVHRTRARAYPGLLSPAPNTAGVYRVAQRELAKCKSALDVGCGSGAGTRTLVTPGRGVAGLDPSAEAIAFARAFAPQVRLIHGTMDALDRDERFDAALVIDVLGAALEPAKLLRAVRAHLAPGAVLIVGEARAGDAALVAPMRRAFTPGTLESLLVRAGLKPKPVRAAPAEFVVTAAEATSDLRTADALALAEDPTVEGSRALDAVARALENVEDPLEASELLLAYGALHVRQRDLDSAAGTFVGALKMAPNSARGLVGLGDVAEGVGRPRDALRLFEKATQHHPDEVAGWAALGRVEAKLGHARAARDALARATALAPADAALTELYATVAEPADAAEATSRLAELAAAEAW